MLKGNKSDLRSYFLEQRNLLSPEAHKSLNQDILHQFIAAFPEPKGTFSVYLPMPSKKEIDTLPFIDYLLQKNCRVACPIADWNTKTIHHNAYSKHAEIVHRKGIPEIINGEDVLAEDIDTVIVPGLCIDSKGFRLGYGGGFYDRFLVTRSFQTIFLSAFSEISSILDVESFDVPIQTAIFPDKVHYYTV
jgi:5-formyltetrahydrofolate cyclo-ligase